MSRFWDMEYRLLAPRAKIPQRKPTPPSQILPGLLAGRRRSRSGRQLDLCAAMPHTPFVSIQMLTVVETSAFARRAEKLLTAEEREDLLFYLATHPELGDEIPGTGGVRKLRFSAKSRGKSGGYG